MSKDSIIDREGYWARVKFVADLYEAQFKAMSTIEGLNIITNLAQNFDVEIDDLHRWIKFGEEPGEKQINIKF